MTAAAPPHGAGPVDHVDMGMPASLVWDYDTYRPRVSELYERTKEIGRASCRERVLDHV